jgi:hypothetical protein
MDIVIPLGNSRIDYLDLKYTLRAVEKFTEAGEVYLIGQKPKWVTNVWHIPFDDDPRKEFKERNIFLKTQEAFKYADRFLFMNDDHVLLQSTDIENYPNYFKGTCYESMLKNNSHYRGTMNHTRKWLESNQHPDLNFDGHCPVILEKGRFERTVATADWSVPYGYGMKSLYCAGLRANYMPDCKLHKKLSYGEAVRATSLRHVISFMDAAVKSGLGQYFNNILPLKSKYEI